MPDKYAELAGRLGLGESERVAGLFKMLCDETEADILLNLPAQTPAVAEKLSLGQDEVDDHFKTLFRKGLVFPSSKTDPPAYRMCHDLLQFHDATILWPEAPEGFLELWKEFMDAEWYTLAKTFGRMLDKPITRVIPVGVSIEAKSDILDFESVAKMIEEADNIAVTACTCRLSMKKCDRPLEVCIQINRAADYTLARGTGRQLSKDEALQMLIECEEAGLVHVTMNRSERNNFICNCCPCCCQAFPVLIEGGVSVVDPSRFTAVIAGEDCTGCGECHERCYFGAIAWSDGEGSVSLVEADKCMGCGLCLVTCPTEAISLEEAREAAFIPGAA